MDRGFACILCRSFTLFLFFHISFIFKRTLFVCLCSCFFICIATAVYHESSFMSTKFHFRAVYFLVQFSPFGFLASENIQSCIRWVWKMQMNAVFDLLLSLSFSFSLTLSYTNTISISISSLIPLIWILYRCGRCIILCSIFIVKKPYGHLTWFQMQNIQWPISQFFTLYEITDIQKCTCKLKIDARNWKFAYCINTHTHTMSHV